MDKTTPAKVVRCEVCKGTGCVPNAKYKYGVACLNCDGLGGVIK